DETLTLQRLGVTGALYRTLRSTNAIENLNSRVGYFIHHVRRWREARMLARWIAAGLQEVRRGFRRLRGHRDLAVLLRALDRRPWTAGRRWHRTHPPSRRSPPFKSERDIISDPQRKGGLL